MTPAVQALKQAGLAHRLCEYTHAESAEGYGLEAANKLGLAPHEVFKTLLVSLDGDAKQLAVTVIPVDKMLDLKAAARAFKAKKAAMADPQIAERVTGYVVGGISPLGQKRRLPTAIDASAEVLEQMYVSGGRRGLDIGLAPQDLAKALLASFLPLARN